MNVCKHRELTDSYSDISYFASIAFLFSSSTRQNKVVTVLKYGINPQVKCSGKNDIISNLGFPRLVKNHQTVLKLADILNRKWQMFNFLCTSR